MPQVKTQDFYRASALSIDDPQLRQALRRVGTGFDNARREAIEEVSAEVWERWREEARQIKEHTIDHLDYYLELLHDNVTRNGGQVHFARDAGQANAVVADLVQRKGVKIVTKGKSMVSEELSLNHVLEEIGTEVYETDLGEYIIQLADETPSHLVAPALHKTRAQVAQLFAD
ncbi:MAG TPA: LUD domain-containing protein, partial [Dehalococcoidia bacterium]|nr:LUD domain-containing protein [Dehalococcoidia bacterium]